MSGKRKNCDLIVRSLTAGAQRGTVQLETLYYPCALGRSGRSHFKREGDGVTPIGRWPIRQILYRADKRSPYPRPSSIPDVPVRAIKIDDGWCDADGDPNYNRHIRHPYPASAERLWRNDMLYDIIVVLGHNERPRLQGGGSAIFMHVADQREDGLHPTAGCVALRPKDLRTVLSLITRRTHVRVVG